MGTRSTVKFYDEHHDKPVCSVYQQYDGYYSGVGKELADFLLDKKVINGFGKPEETMENGYANGMACLAAQYVAANKDSIGGFYMTTEDDIQGYDYEVRLGPNKQPVIKVDDFLGTPQEFLEMLNKEE